MLWSRRCGRLQGGAEHQIERSCREVEELHALIKAEGMDLSDADRASFLLATSDLERLQEAVTAAKAGHEQQGSRFTGLLADGARRLHGLTALCAELHDAFCTNISLTLGLYGGQAIGPCSKNMSTSLQTHNAR